MSEKSKGEAYVYRKGGGFRENDRTSILTMIEMRAVNRMCEMDRMAHRPQAEGSTILPRIVGILVDLEHGERTRVVLEELRVDKRGKCNVQPAVGRLSRGHVLKRNGPRPVVQRAVCAS